MRKYLVALLACCMFRWASAQVLLGSKLGLTPTTLPPTCNVGDVQVDPISYVLNLCGTSNNWSPIPIGNSLATDWHSSNSVSLNGATYSAIYVNATPAAGFAAYGMADYTASTGGPDLLQVLGGSITNTASGAGAGELDAIAGNTSGTGPGGLLYLQGGNSTNGKGGNVNVFSGTGITTAGTVIIGPGASTGQLRFINVNEGTVGNAFVSTDTFGDGHWGIPASASRAGTAAFATSSGTASAVGFNLTGDVTMPANANNTTVAAIRGQTVGGTTGTGSVVFSASPTLTGQLFLPNGSVSAPAMSFTNNTNSGVYAISTAEYSFAVQGTQVLDFLKSAGGFGNMGIGTAASSADLFPIQQVRSAAGVVVNYMSNVDGGAGSGVGVQYVANAGQQLGAIQVMSTNTAAPDAYNGGSFVMRATLTLPHMSFISDNTGGDIKFYTDGYADASNKRMTINSSGVTLTTPLGIASGGTGQTAATAAFYALSPCNGVFGGVESYSASTVGCLTPAVASAGLPYLSGGGSVPNAFSGLGIAGGGTNNTALSTTAGGVLYMDGSKEQNTGAGASGQVLLSQGASAPIWSNVIPRLEMIYQATAATTFSSASETDVPFALKVFDNDTAYSGTVFTAPATGAYQFTLRLSIGATAAQTGYYYCLIANSSNTQIGMIQQASHPTNLIGSIDSQCGGAAIIQMTAGDTAKVRFNQFIQTTVTAQVGAQLNNSLEILRVR